MGNKSHVVDPNGFDGGVPGHHWCWAEMRWLHDVPAEHLFRICGECQHQYTKLTLVSMHNRLLDELESDSRRSTLEDAENIYSCPCCAHDF